MKRKTITGLCLSLLLAVSTLIPTVMEPIKASNAQTGALRWFKDQLNNQEQIFYQALTKLYTSKDLETGTAGVDMTTLGITKSQIETYLNGDNTLEQAFHNAKDAFFYDYGDVFYVNPAKITLRTGRKSDGSYVMTLGKGANKNYYADGFNSKDDVEKAKTAIETSSSVILANINDSMTTQEKLKVAHDALIAKVDYKYPLEATPAQIPHLDSVYGALVNGAAQCGGYSKAYRYLLNEMGISNVLVYGIRNFDGETNAKSSDAVSNEEHMWNMVQIEDMWFAIDTTWDDPIGGSLRDTYFLKGSEKFDATHLEQGVLSLNGKAFTYPKLSVNDYSDISVEVEENNNGLKVERYKAVEGKDEMLSSYKVTYNGLSEEQANEQGMHFAFRSGTQADESNITWTQWSPIAEHAADHNGVATKLDASEGGGYLVFTGQKGYIQFLITKAKPQAGYIFEGEADSEINKVSLSDMISVDTYVEKDIRPFIIDGTPTPLSTLRLVDQWIEIETDERLELIDPAQGPSIEMTNTDKLMDAKVSQVTYKDSSYVLANGTRMLSTKVRFYFQPDKTFQSNVNTYTFTIKNMRGIYTKKEANSVNYKTSYPMHIPCPLRKYTTPPTAQIVGDPILVADDQLEAFEANGGVSTSSLHVQLVATKPDAQKQTILDNSLSSALNGAAPLKSSTFDITLSCAALRAYIKPGYKVMIGLPYPEGFDYRTNKDVVFKAYHFKDDGKGNFIPEELICQITPAGLMVMAESFSPFTIVALNKSDVPVNNDVKTAMVSLGSEGGSVYTTIKDEQIPAVAIHTLTKDEKKTFKVKADEGYVIEKILIDGKEVELEDNAEQYEKVFNFADMDANSTMEAYFVSKTTKAEEKAQGITPLLPKKETIDPDTDTTPETVYKSQTLSDKDSGIHITGELKEGVSFHVEKNTDDKAAAAFKRVAGSNEILKTFDLSLSADDAYKGKLKLTFPIDKQYEGRTIHVLHYVNDNVDQTSVIVKDGSISIEVESLSPFALVLVNETKTDNGEQTTPELEPNNPDQTTPQNTSEKKDDVDTGDRTVPPFWYLSAMLCSGGILYVLKKKRDLLETMK